jgi:hypothetical protein
MFLPRAGEISSPAVSFATMIWKEIFFYLIFFSFFSLIKGKTNADLLNKKFVGDFALLKAVLEGDIKGLRNALLHHANVDVILTQEIGERYLKIGKVGIDFPIAPALHLAFFGGTYEHRRVAHQLIVSGADMNYFHFERNGSNVIPIFPPPIYFGLGAFRPPTPAQAGILDAIFQSYSTRLNYTSLTTWVRITGYPPPLHTCVLYNNADGIYMLSSIPTYDMNERDSQSLTALHIAAWLGNIVHISLLIQRGANPFAQDSHNRTFLHYCAIRGMASVINQILKKPSALSDSIKAQLVSMRDYANKTAFDIATMSPAQIPVIQALKSLGAPQFTTTDILSTPLQILQNDTKIPKKSKSTWRTVDTITNSDLWKIYHLAQRPTKIIGNITSTIKLWALVSNKQALIQHYGDLFMDITCSNPIPPSNLHECPYLSEFNQLTLRDFLSHDCLILVDAVEPFDSNECQSFSAVASLNYDNFLEDLSSSEKLSSLFQHCSRSEPPLTQLRLTKGNVDGISLRSQSAMWNTLLSGSPRTWYLLSPGTALDLVFSLESNNGTSNSDNLDPNDPLKPDLSPREWKSEILPFLMKRRLVSSTVQSPGDLVYIPHGWSYVVVESGEETIDLTVSFCTTNAQTIFEQIPIGQRLYGTNLYPE